MKYLRSIGGTIVECKDSETYKYKGYIEMTKDEAYMFLFDKISHRLGAKYANYNHIDIGSELLLWLLTRYKTNGNYAAEKSFDDNSRIWWSVANKRANWIIREYRRKHKHEELYDEIPEDALTCEDFEIEHTASVEAIMEYINTLMKSEKSNEQQLGILGYAKINGLTDEQVCDVLEVKMGRLYELKRALKRRLNNYIGENL